jgi:hypothetical protein
MTQRRDRTGPDDQVGGQSRFAQRGMSHEERMSEDDSARRFPGEGRTRQDARYDGSPGRDPYGSGGSFGYGGGFEHGGQPGYREQNNGRGNYGRGEEFYESRGGFGRDVGGYGREGLGYPGQGEDRYGSPGTQGSRRSPQEGPDDARKGYTQDAGYAQSGGEHKEGERGSQGQGRGPGAGRFYGNSGGPGQSGGRGRFYGRTPQGYTRADDRIREDVCDHLSHGHIDPSEISVKVQDGVVTLEGVIESRSEKFHAEEVADAVLGVKDVDNRLRVRKPGQASTQEQQPDKPANEVTEGNLDAGPQHKGRN